MSDTPTVGQPRRKRLRSYAYRLLEIAAVLVFVILFFVIIQFINEIIILLLFLSPFYVFYLMGKEDPTFLMKPLWLLFPAAFGSVVTPMVGIMAAWMSLGRSGIQWPIYPPLMFQLAFVVGYSLALVAAPWFVKNHASVTHLDIGKNDVGSEIDCLRLTDSIARLLIHPVFSVILFCVGGVFITGLILQDPKASDITLHIGRYSDSMKSRILGDSLRQSQLISDMFFSKAVIVGVITLAATALGEVIIWFLALVRRFASFRLYFSIVSGYALVPLIAGWCMLAFYCPKGELVESRFEAACMLLGYLVSSVWLAYVIGTLAVVMWREMKTKTIKGSRQTGNTDDKRPRL